MDFICKHQHIDTILETYKSQIGKQFTSYKNHVYRVFNLTHLLTPKKISDLNSDILAIAAAFHDIGIWTHNTFDYLKPSIELALDYLDQVGLSAHKDEVALIIDMHHKSTIYYGKFETNVELFRKADWTDVSLGVMSFRLHHLKIKALNKAFPLKGFHTFLVKQTAMNFLKHPFNPLPMFKK